MQQAERESCADGDCGMGIRKVLGWTLLVVPWAAGGLMAFHYVARCTWWQSLGSIGILIAFGGCMAGGMRLIESKNGNGSGR